MSARMLRLLAAGLAIALIGGGVTGFAASNTVEPTRISVEHIPAGVPEP